MHRRRYDDWTLPKGKLQGQESWTDAAVREVREETGCPVCVEDFAGSTSYSVDDQPKVVLFWHMSVVADCAGALDPEVGEVAWLTADGAGARLTYPLERALLDGALAALEAREAGRAAAGDGEFDEERFHELTAGSSVSLRRPWWHLRRRWQSDSAERLASTLPTYRIELANLVVNLPRPAPRKASTGDDAGPPTATGPAPPVPGPTGYRWADAALLLLDRAESALAANDPELGWRCFKAATRLELYGLSALPDRNAFTARARHIHREAIEKLTGWRKAVVLDLLGRNAPDAQLSAERVTSAAQILHEHQDNTYVKLRVVERQLNLLTAGAVVVVAAWIGAAAAAPFTTTAPFTDDAALLGSWSFVVAVVLFGIMGATLSGLLSTAQGAGSRRIPEQLLDARVTRARLAMGAMAAVAVTTFLISGLLNLGTLNGGLLLAAAFAAGFSERLVKRAVEAIVLPGGGGTPAPQGDQPAAPPGAGGGQTQLPKEDSGTARTEQGRTT